MTTLLNNYNLTFKKIKLAKGHTTKTASGDGMLSGFLSSIDDPNTIDKQIKNIDHYINGGLDDYEKCIVATPMYTAWLDNDEADIYFNGDEQTSQSIPISDFKEILLQWKTFIK